MKLAIKTDVLRAVALFAGDRDIREYLNGVFIETGPSGARMVATDGHTLCLVNLSSDPYPQATIIAPVELIQELKIPRKKGEVWLDFNEGDSGQMLRVITATYLDVTATRSEKGGKFPDYRRVLPVSTTGVLAHYEPMYLSRVAQAAQYIGVKYPGIAHNGPGSPGLCILRDDVLALVVAKINVDPVKTRPAWAMANPTEELADLS